jgi:cytochrome c
LREGQIVKREQTCALEFYRAVVNLISVKTVAEIKSAINTLPDKDAWTVAEWLRQHLNARGSKPGEMQDIIEVMSKRFSTGEHDIAARHDEHQP